MTAPVKVRYDTVSREIRSQVTLFPAEPFASGPAEPVVCDGVWDTGANSSSISEKAARMLDLTPVGCLDVETANGRRETPVYKIDILLPNNICVKGAYVTESDIAACDMLVGMDVISLGDFLITNRGRTEFTFRIPSEGSAPFERKEF